MKRKLKTYRLALSLVAYDPETHEAIDWMKLHTRVNGYKTPTINALPQMGNVNVGSVAIDGTKRQIVLMLKDLIHRYCAEFESESRRDRLEAPLVLTRNGAVEY